MTETKELLRRGGEGFAPRDAIMDSLIRRRDRKRRNQRIAAGVVGIAVFVAAVWIVTSVPSLDRSETSVVPGGDVTGPAETGPTGSPDAGWDGNGIPPEGTRLSTPVEGELIRKYKGWPSSTYVYADGRVIWQRNPFLGGGHLLVLERRLTPEGVDLVRSGAKLDEIPEGAWAAKPRLYVPPRYSVCFWKMAQELDPSAVMDMLPPPAEALLRGKDPDPSNGCLVLPTQEARALDEMLSEAGLFPGPADRAAAEWFLSGVSTSAWGIKHHPNAIHASLIPLSPDGGNLVPRRKG